MEKPICLITGATEGVGKATATELARKGFAIVVAARNAAKAKTVTKEIAVATGNSDVDYIIADLRSLTQLRQLSETFERRYPRLDVLINNAGIVMPERVLTEDGYETTFQVNYLSQFHLTHLLLDALKRSPLSGRIINLSSSVYRAGKFDPDNLQSERRFSPLRSYAASKLLVRLFTIELANRLAGTPISANAAHPGVVRTQMMLRVPGGLRAISYAALPFSLSPQRGAHTTVYLASSPEVADISGKYFTHNKVKKVETMFNSQESRDFLWTLSMNACKRVLPT
jgi:retinol dehydrogenase 12